MKEYRHAKNKEGPDGHESERVETETLGAGETSTQEGYGKKKECQAFGTRGWQYEEGRQPIQDAKKKRHRGKEGEGELPLPTREAWRTGEQSALTGSERGQNPE